MSSPFYESADARSQYLLFHYGTPEQICPILPAAREACGFPVRAVVETVPRLALAKKSWALDLGCAVGRSSLELARHFDSVVGIDFSQGFIAAAQALQASGQARVAVPREGGLSDEYLLELPNELTEDVRQRVRFEPGDACALRADLGTFDFVLLANLIDRLPDPARCLARLPDLVRPGGGLVITSPYTWLEEYTPRSLWLEQGAGTLAGLQAHLDSAFTLEETRDLPFLIREHHRKYQWSVAEASLWKKKG